MQSCRNVLKMWKVCETAKLKIDTTQLFIQS